MSDGDTDTGTVTINVYNTAPVAYDSSETISQDETLSSFVSGPDMDGDPIIFSVAAIIVASCVRDVA